jgi:hypothetical protein
VIRLCARSAQVFAGTVLIALGGCGGDGASAPNNSETSHLRVITALYFRATSALGKKPASEQEFKTFLAGDSLDLDVLGVDSIDDLFVSERDGQPLVILYGSDRKGVDPRVVAYEAVGKDGARLVGFDSGQITEADETHFKELVPAPVVG